MWKQFKPTILFLARFFGVYILLSIFYGLFIQEYDSREPAELDPFTAVVASHCSRSASLLGYSATLIPNEHLRRESAPEQTFHSLWLDDKYAISIEEGCNGLNIMILFTSFVIAFGGKWLHMLIFIPLGWIFIHLANLARLFLLSFLNVSQDSQAAFHFFHKYGFTAILYLAILLLWYFWVMHWNGRSQPSVRAAKRDSPES